jgi:WD40 repeat protein
LGIAVTPDGARAYVASFIPGQLGSFNLISQQLEATIPLAGGTTGSRSGVAVTANPGLANAGSHVAYVVSGQFVGPAEDEVLHVVDADPASPNFNTVVRTIAAGFNDGVNRGALDATPDGRFVFHSGTILNVFNNGRIIVYDVLAGNVLTVHSTQAMGVFRFQPDVEITPDGSYLLLRRALNGSIRVFDLAGSFVAEIGTPGLDFNLYEVVGNRLYALDTSQRLQIFNWDPVTPNFSPLSAPLQLSGGAAGMTIVPDGSLVYVTLQSQNAVAIIDTARLMGGHPSPILTRVGVGVGPFGIAFRPGTPTETGSNVVVQPIQEVSLSFTNVTSGGQTTVATTNTTAVSVPSGFQVGDIPIYYEITSTATFNGPVEVCFHYDENLISGPEPQLRVLHEENGVFVDRTVSLDSQNNIICALVDSFSAFVVGVGSTEFLFDSLIDGIAAATDNPGIRRSLQAKVLNSRAAHDRGDLEAARNMLEALLQELQGLRGGQLSEATADDLITDVEALLGTI